MDEKTQARFGLDSHCWPSGAHFAFGEMVERSDSRDGKAPPYRFRGKVVGWYMTGNTLGYAVNSENEPGCIQIFPSYMLRRVSSDDQLKIMRMRELLRPFKTVADMSTNEPSNSSVFVNVNRCRDVKEFLENE